MSGEQIESGDVFEASLNREILHSERVRAASLMGLIAFAMLLVSILWQFYEDQYLALFGQVETRNAILLLFTGLALYEAMVWIAIGIVLRRMKRVPAIVRYWNALIETSVPTLMMLIVADRSDAVIALLSPAPFAYFFFIVLSTLRLNFSLSVFTGLVGGIEYTVLSYVFFSGPETTPAAQALAVPIGYVTKGILLALSGVLAGFVGSQIRLRVSSSFRTLSERDKAISLFGQQVSRAVADELLNHQQTSRKQHVCVMFLDIRNFTPLVEKKTPEEVVAYLNVLFSFMIEIVNRKHGIINQFLGDGFMATFGAPLSAGNDCRNAVEAAVEIVERVGAAERAGEVPPTRLGIGLHAGEAVTGNIGSAIRKQYSITGNVVITASRIEQLNKEYGSQILVSREVWDAVGGDNNAVLLGQVMVKGREEPVTLIKLA